LLSDPSIPRFIFVSGPCRQDGPLLELYIKAGINNIDKFNLNEIGLIYTVLTRASVALDILGTKEDLGKLQIVPDNILKVA